MPQPLAAWQRAVHYSANGRHQQRGDGGGVCLRYKGEHYEHYQAVRDGSAWICSAVRQCIGPTAIVPAAAPITITATTNRHPDCSAIRPAPAPITAISISIHSLPNELRYAGHELPECVCPRRSQSVLQSELQQPTTGVQAILRSGAVVSAPGALRSEPEIIGASRYLCSSTARSSVRDKPGAGSRSKILD